MASLEELRGELDRLDEQIIALYERRMEVCSCVADYKIKNGKSTIGSGSRRSLQRRLRR